MPRLSAVEIFGLQAKGGCQRRPGSTRRGGRRSRRCAQPAHRCRWHGRRCAQPRARCRGWCGGEDEDVAAAEMDEELAREEAVDALALLALSAGGEQQAVTCGDLGKVGGGRGRPWGWRRNRRGRRPRRRGLWMGR